LKLDNRRKALEIYDELKEDGYDILLLSPTTSCLRCEGRTTIKVHEKNPKTLNYSHRPCKHRRHHERHQQGQLVRYIPNLDKDDLILTVRNPYQLPAGRGNQAENADLQAINENLEKLVEDVRQR
jgi:neutral trehalase